ncbi:MAG: hypothetical protein WAO22_01940 [bacterium]
MSRSKVFIATITSQIGLLSTEYHNNTILANCWCRFVFNHGSEGVAAVVGIINSEA